MPEVRKFAVVPRPHYQVPVIGEKTIGQQPHARHVLQSLSQDTFKGGIIVVLLKKGQPSIGAV
jgi:hypothetical protein